MGRSSSIGGQGARSARFLRRGLRRAGLSFREVNIWDDPQAAAFVRSVARGSETVPTVSIGAVNLVNPSARLVLEVAANETLAGEEVS